MAELYWWRLVRFGFRLLYNEMAFTYDWVSQIVSLGEWRCWQQTALEYLPNPHEGLILELAHGTGNLQLDLNTAGYRAIGYDLSAAMGRIAANKLQKRKLPVNLVRGEGQRLPFQDGQFTAIVCTFPTNFITAEDTLREMYRVLQPGGSAIIVMSGLLQGQTPLHRFIEWLYAITGQRGDEVVDAQDYFGNVGFTIETIEATCPNSRVQLVRLNKPR
ncbi:MAG: class I SAM-dependent methyltransferase [Anaerolineae bacterium]|nr:class I SAM-dependent methyltransferase [Anaerolineae bacterium]